MNQLSESRVVSVVDEDGIKLTVTKGVSYRAAGEGAGAADRSPSHVWGSQPVTGLGAH